jgi:hypothetical protein
MNYHYTNSIIRIGILIDSDNLEAWTHEIIRTIKSLDYATIELVLMNKSYEPDKKKHSVSLFNLYRYLDSKMYSPRLNALEKIDASNLIAGIPRIDVDETQLSSFIDQSLTETIKKYQIDLFLQFGFANIDKLSLSKTSKYGVWYFFHGDIENPANTPPGLMEVLEGRREIGAYLLMTSEKIAGEKIIYQSFTSAGNKSMMENNNINYWKSVSFIPRTLKELSDPGEEKFFEKISRSIRPPNHRSFGQYIAPGNIQMFKALLPFAIKKIFNKIRKFFYFEQWVLLFSYTEPNLSPNFRNFKEMLPAKDQFWADPHIILHDDKYYIFIEEMIFKNRRAHISVITLDKHCNHDQPRIVLQKPYHLSYPFVFRHDNRYYMIPETSENQTIELYRCTGFPDKWEFVMNLMENVEAVDTTLLERDGKWWMFVNIREHPGASLSEELFLFHSTELMTNKWKPHPMNPVISDVKNARQAGKIFEMNGNLYRVGQDCSVRYGYAMNINRITALNENEYSEIRVQEITPSWKNNLLRTHTLNFQNGLAVIDASILRRKSGD